LALVPHPMNTRAQLRLLLPKVWIVPLVLSDDNNKECSVCSHYPQLGGRDRSRPLRCCALNQRDNKNEERSMKTRVAALAVVFAIGVASFLIAGERPRYVRGTGLAGLAGPSCGLCADYCPTCPPQQVRSPIGWGWPTLGCRPGLGCMGDPQQCIQPGPPTAAVTYPYYTVRGPRDFLQRQPSPIGP